MTGAGAGASLALEQHRQVTGAILSDDEIGRTWRVAKSLAASGMFKDVTQAEQAFGRILIGRDLGLSAAQSLMGIDVVRGNLQLRGILLGRFVRESPTYDYKILARNKTAGEESATVAVYMRDPDTGQFPRDADGVRIPEGEETFTIEDARKMNLVRDGSAWTTVPAVMVVWRALAQAVRFNAPDLLGGIPVYTEADGLEPLPSLGTGDGDGSEPGWQGVSSTQIKALEGMLVRAGELGHAGLADRATVQMRVAGQTPGFVDEQLQAWATELAEFEASIPATAEEVDEDPEATAEGEQQTLDEGEGT